MIYLRTLAILTWLSISSSAWAGFVLSIDSADLGVTATGGVVTHALNLRITHNGIGSNLFSGYDLEIAPASGRVVVVEGPVTTSDFAFDLGHMTFGGGNPWHISGENLSTNVAVTPGGTNLLARFFLEIDTSVGIPNTIDLGLAIQSANRNGLGGLDVTSEFSVVPATLTINAVPEPSSCILTAIALGGVAYRYRKRRQTTKPVDG